MANDLIDLYNASRKCKAASDFSSIAEYDYCIKTLTQLQYETPKDNYLYNGILNATDLSIKRIKMQKELHYRPFKKESDFMKLRSQRQFLRDDENTSWKQLEKMRTEKMTVNDEKPHVLFNPENLSNITLVIILFMIFFFYRMISSKAMGKIKTRSILKSFQQDDLAELVDRDTFDREKYRIARMGFKLEKELTPNSELTESEKLKVQRIYQYIHILELAMSADMAENKFNVFVGVNLKLPKNQLALDSFLEKINEKSFVKDN